MAVSAWVEPFPRGRGSFRPRGALRAIDFTAIGNATGE